ncbi:MAG: hypothetical protein ABIF17_04890 [Patescibacteria group bacterium]
MLKKTLLISTVFALIFCSSAVVLAETVENADEPEETVLEITEEDLDIEGTSWFHNAWRNIKIFVIKDPIKKSELRLQQASAQLLKAQYRVNQNPDSEKAEEWLDKATKKYDGLMEKINARITTAEKNNSDSEKMNKFLDKYSDHLLKHQEIMQNLETQVPKRAMEKIRIQREAHLERFSETMIKLENKEQFAERLKNALQNKASSSLRRAQQYDVIEELQEVVPEIEEEIGDKLGEIKTENKELWQNIQETHQEILQNRGKLQEIKVQVKNRVKANK